MVQPNLIAESVSSWITQVSPASMSRLTHTGVKWLTLVSQFDSCRWVTVTHVWVNLTHTSESPWLWQVMHQSQEWYRPMLISNEHLVHLLMLYITIIAHILYRDYRQSHLFKVVCHNMMGLFILYCTYQLWGYMGQLYKCNINLFCFTIRPVLLQMFSRWN